MKKKKKNPPDFRDWIIKYFVRPIQDAITAIISTFKDTVTALDFSKPAADSVEAATRATATLDELLKPKSPITPEEALARVGTFLSKVDREFQDLFIRTVYAEILGVGVVDVPAGLLSRDPKVAALLSTGEKAYAAAWESSVLPFLRMYYLSKFQPFIPRIEDLRLMAVREAFPVKPGKPQYAEMEKFALLQGMNSYWTERYLYMGFERMNVRDAVKYFMHFHYEPKKYEEWLRIADIHPDDRPRVAEVAFVPPGVREIGYGWDVGAYEEADVEVFRRKAGQSPDDAKKSAFAMVKYRLAAEEEALRREALYDYTAGLDTEAQLRANLKAFRSRPEVIDLWVERAKYRAERDLKLDQVKAVTTDFVKGWSTENDFRQDLIELGVVPERRDVIIKQAKSRRLSYKRAEAAEKHKLLTSAKISKARELGLIGDEDFVDRHVKANYTEDDARLLLAVELTPRPVTAEEIERRKKTVISRLNRAKRRWETSLKRVQDQIDLTALQRDDQETVMKESLDVIDAQITIIEDSIPLVTPEKAEELTKKRDLLVQRRELSEARATARIHKLTEQHTNLLEQKALMQRQRDEEIGEYQEELKLMGEVAG